MRNNDMIYLLLNELAREKTITNFEVNSGIISDVVEGWNQNIYVVPNKIILNKRDNLKNFKIM